MPETSIHGFHVIYEDHDYPGIRYLRDDLDQREAKVFFDQARQRGSAQFESDGELNFTLAYHDGEYALSRRSGGGGGFF